MITRIKKLASRLLPSNQYARSVSILAGGTITSQLLTIVATPFLSRLYTPADYGLLALFMALSGILATIITLQYETAVLLPKKEGDAIALVVLSIVVAIVIGLFFSVLAWIIYLIIRNIKVIPSPSAWLFVTILTAIGGSIIATTIGWLNRKCAYKKITQVRIGQAVASVIISILLGWIGISSGLIIAQIIGVLVGLLLISFQLMPLLKGGVGVSLHVLFKVASEHQAAPKYLLPTALLDVVTLQLPIFFISAWFSTETAGQFSLAWRLLALPITLIGSAVGQVFFQRFAQAWPDVIEARNLLFKTWVSLSLVGILPMLFVMIYGDIFFIILFGDAWVESGVIASVIAPMVFAMLISSPTSSIFLVLGLQKYSLFFGLSVLIYRSGSLYFGIIVNNLYLGLTIWVILEILQIILFNLMALRRMNKPEMASFFSLKGQNE